MKNKDITKVIMQGRAYKSGSFLLKIIPQGASTEAPGGTTGLHVRNVAVLCSKKVFKTAVLRNKMRRKVKSALTSIKKEYSDVLDYKDYLLVFNAYDSLPKTKPEELKDEVRNILKKSGMLKI